MKNLIIISCIGLILILFLYFFRTETNLNSNFSRTITELGDPKELYINIENTNIKSVDNNILIFNRAEASLLLIEPTDSKYDTLSFLNLDNRLRKEFIINVEYKDSYYYFFCPRKNRIEKINKDNLSDSSFFKTKFMFSRGTILGKDTIVTKETSDNNGAVEGFVSYNSFNNSRNMINSDLPVTPDGGLGTDGFFSKGNNGILSFTSYYTNNIYFLKKGLFYKKINAIGGDRPHPKVITKGKGVYTLKDLETAVNEDGEIYSHKIYILSNLKGKNEKNGSYIDVYDINTGMYIKSFFIANYNNKKVKDFAISKNKLLAIQGNKIITYSINEN